MWNLSPYLLWEERTEVLEQLSFLIEKYSQKYKKTPFGQTALSPPWYRMRFSPILFCLVLKTLTEVTVLREVGWIRDLICHLGTGGRFWYSFSVFKETKGWDLVPCCGVSLTPGTVICPEGISAFTVSASSLFEAWGLEHLARKMQPEGDAQLLELVLVFDKLRFSALWIKASGNRAVRVLTIWITFNFVGF